MELREGQVAVITGGASGIGFGLAEAFGARGLSVVLGDIEEAALDTASEALAERGVRTLTVPTDVTDPAALDSLRDRALAELGRIDVICNNAGVISSPMRPTWEYDLADWVWVLDVNLWGVIHGIRSFVPVLVAQGQGHVLNTASMAGLSTVPGIAPYTAAKRAVVGLSESLAQELAPHGVGVTALCPGLVTTRIGEAGRNRPRSGPAAATAPPEAPQQLPPHIPQISATEAGEIAVTAVEAGTLHTAPGPGTTDQILGWQKSVRDSLGV
jgi:NAD(P)-dependent dehydrogenase (short-subunit alcohol dehydrogenase family)